MRYFHVDDDGAIEEGPRALPTAWRNVSGLQHSTPAELAALGWLPETVVGFEPFDPTTQVREGPVHQVNADDVTATYTVRAMTAAEQAAHDSADASQQLDATDKDMARVAEDVIAAILKKGLLADEDLPQTARDKIAQRNAWRAKIPAP